MSEEKVLPFIEHLVELRKRLMVIVIAVVIGMGVAWNFSSGLLNFIEKPLTGATYLTEVKKRAYAQGQGVEPRALRPLQNWSRRSALPSRNTPSTTARPLEPFFDPMQDLHAGRFSSWSCRSSFHQLWQFIAPGLTRKERQPGNPLHYRRHGHLLHRGHVFPSRDLAGDYQFFPLL